jgi:3-deoxy-D-manno-octulosonic-acid transferase
LCSTKSCLFHFAFITFVPAPKNPQMQLVYNLAIEAYSLAITLATPFNARASDWVAGRKKIIQTIKATVREGERRIWFHAASLGEFEQGRPVMESFRQVNPDVKIVLTFFSPSGYNVRKNYQGADYVFYLPADTPRKAAAFVSAIDPVAAIFIKYEFWYNYLRVLKERDIPSILISGIFRPQHHFFRWYGRFFRKMLHLFDHLFVQDQASASLLHGIGLENVTVSGDTRFDRVVEIAAKAEPVEVASRFSLDEKVLVAGSSWPGDEDIIARYRSENPGRFRYIIAPHEVDSRNVDRIAGLFGTGCVRFTEYQHSSHSGSDVLILDTIGILSSVYRYAYICCIGGGFGKGIHNILEAAAWGKPVLFGPNFQKFREANELIALGGAKSFGSYEQFKAVVNKWSGCEDSYNEATVACADYVSDNKGSTKLIVAYLLNLQSDEQMNKEG